MKKGYYVGMTIVLLILLGYGYLEYRHIQMTRRTVSWDNLSSTLKVRLSKNISSLESFDIVIDKDKEQTKLLTCLITSMMNPPILGLENNQNITFIEMNKAMDLEHYSTCHMDQLKEIMNVEEQKRYQSIQSRDDLFWNYRYTSLIRSFSMLDVLNGNLEYHSEKIELLLDIMKRIGGN